MVDGSVFRDEMDGVPQLPPLVLFLHCKSHTPPPHPPSTGDTSPTNTASPLTPHPPQSTCPQLSSLPPTMVHPLHLSPSFSPTLIGSRNVTAPKPPPASWEVVSWVSS
ncbi:hypothetical protein HJC23_008202 [Cyclotella cryptica]|uniref:Uncharacterized protein n=1 Tax=Cyclotella cryptica TaxID=29204 RepID=A0ABD3PH45_9STRA